MTNKALLLLKMNGPTLRGNLTLEDFLNAPKCYSSAYNLRLINSNAKILGVKKAGNLYGSLVNPYTLRTINYLYKNQSPVFSFEEDCNISLMSSNTLGKTS